MINAIQKSDEKAVTEIAADIAKIPDKSTPELRAKYLSVSYNVQYERCDWNSSGFADFGPTRVPYRDFPDEWKKHIENPERLKTLAEIRKKYTKVPTR